MRGVAWCLVVVIVGAVTGTVITRAEFHGVRERFDPNSGVGTDAQAAGVSDLLKSQGKALPAAAGAAVEVVGSDVHDFGYMENDSSGSHTFLIRNSGTGTLKLEAGGTSCQACTIASLAEKEVNPGEGTRVTIDWKVSSPDLDYRKEAYILTNDPKHPTLILTIKGKVVKSVRVEDEEIKLGSIPLTEGRTGSARVYCFRQAPLEFKSIQFVNDETKEFYSVETRPLTPEELATREGALHGIEVSVTAKPGLPLGTILQTVRLESNWEDLRYVDIPIRGTVMSDISILGGKSYDPVGNVFKLDVVPRDEGRKVQAQITVKGASRHDIKFIVHSVDPSESLRVTIGDPKPVNNGAVVMFPLTIEVPPGSPPVSRLGGVNRDDYGRIRIKTTHALNTELQLLVRFAVQ